MTITVTTEQVTEALNAAVAEKGEDYVYPSSEKGWRDEHGNVHRDGDESCLYATYEPGPDGRLVPTGPSCIVGNVLHRLGVGVHALSANEGTAAREVISILLDNGTFEDFPQEALESLQMAQWRQDDGRGWGEARDAYTFALAAGRV